MTRIIIIAAAAVVAIGLGYLALQTAYQRGREAERASTLKKAISLVQERDRLNAQVRTATPADICNRLGGNWLPDTNECG